MGKKKWQVTRLGFCPELNLQFVATSTHAQHWSPPSPHSAKINVDVTVGLCFSVIAVVARDWRGELVLAYSKKVNTTLPLQAEAEALKWVLSLAPYLVFEAMCVESDSQICANLLSDKESAHPWRIKSIIADARALLFASPSISVCWVNRQCNYAPHSLVRWSLDCNFFVLLL